MISLATSMAVFIGVLIGIALATMIGMVMLSKDLYSISERLNSINNQNSTVLSNLNNPAVSGLMNHISHQERDNGFEAGLNLAVLCLHRMYDKDGMLVGDFDQLSEQMRENMSDLINNENKYLKARTKLEKYYESQKPNDESDDTDVDD
jgi:uncharacterized membrane protein YgaE (UPF0421/DUF939 family)